MDAVELAEWYELWPISDWMTSGEPTTHDDFVRVDIDRLRAAHTSRPYRRMNPDGTSTIVLPGQS